MVSVDVVSLALASHDRHTPRTMLASTQNPFGGRIVDEDALPTDPREFATLLEASVEAWRGEGCKVVWLRLPLHTAALVPDCRGFRLCLSPRN